MTIKSHSKRTVKLTDSTSLQQAQAKASLILITVEYRMQEVNLALKASIVLKADIMISCLSRTMTIYINTK